MEIIKDFDCVAMKNDIQRKLQDEYAGLADDEIRERRRHKLETSDHPAAVLWRRLVAREKNAPLSSR